MINYPLSKEVQAAVEARDSECYSNAWRGALYLLENGHDDVTYVVGMYTTPHITTPLYHCWLVCSDENANNQIVDPTTVISYDEDESDIVEYQRIKSYSSDYIIDYEKALNGSPFIDIERPITKDEFKDFDSAELKAAYRAAIDNAKSSNAKREFTNMKYYKSYAKTNEDSALRNPDLLTWLSDSRDVLQQISNQGGSREGILPLILAIWGACDGFDDRYPAAADDSVWLPELAESLGNLVSMCSMDSVGDDALFTECGNIAYDFQESIDSIEGYMDEVAEQPVVTVAIADKSYGGARVKLTAGDVARWLKEQIPGTDARQQKQITKKMEGELESLFKEFLKLIDWWHGIADQYGDLAGQVDNFVSEFQQGIANAAPTIYAENWDAQGGFQDWFNTNVYPVMNTIRPFGRGAKPFDTVLRAFENIAKETADLAKIDLNSLIPEGYLNDEPNSLPEWQAAASIQFNKSSRKSSGSFLDWLNDMIQYMDKLARARVTFVNDSIDNIEQKYEEAKDWDKDERIHNDYAFDVVVDKFKKIADQAYKVDTNYDITPESTYFRQLCTTMIDDLRKIASDEENVSEKSFKAVDSSDVEDFIDWLINTGSLILGYYNEMQTNRINDFADSLTRIANTAKKWDKEKPVEDEFESLSSMIESLEFLAKQAGKVTGSTNASAFRLNAKDIGEGFIDMATQVKDEGML